MKKHFHFHFYIRIFFLSVLASALFFVAYQKIAKANTTVETGTYPFAGWAWSPNIGWLSLNCLNDFNGDGDLNDPDDDTCVSGGGLVDYGLELEVTAASNQRVVTGCAWAGNIEWWICFDDPGSTQAPTNGVFLNGPSGDQYYPPNTLILSPDNVLVENSLCHDEESACHASILPLEDETDWTWELGFPIAPVAGSGSGVLDSCFNCQVGTAMVCSDDPLVNCEVDPNVCADNSLGTCITVDNNTCDNCLKYIYDGDGNLTSTQAGYQCSDCSITTPLDEKNARCPANAYNDNTNSCQTCDKYYTTPGLMVDYASSTVNDGYGYMCGWGWNKHSVSGFGVGWLQFSPRITADNNPYFQVDAGNIYSKGNITGTYPLPPNRYNAYIIEAGGDITNFYASSTKTNAQGLSLPVRANSSRINFPSLSNGYYKNVLGKIDYSGLITPIAGEDYNKYNSSVEQSAVPHFWIGGATSLNDTVYISNVDETGPSMDRIIVGGSRGSGIFIVNGNLNITHNITYANTEVDKLSEIASLVWIVNGDVTISSGVTEVAGTFIVLGDGVHADCSAADPGCGQFITTGPGSDTLNIYGSVLAKKFDLNRTYATNGEPAEKFINDGRLQANPPKGMQNFAKGLPKFNYNPY